MMEELDECELGRQDYWNTRYREEVKNFHSHGDVGEIWFGEDIVDKIIRYLNKNSAKDKKILDVGCGNGMLLIELFREDYTNLTGVDYSNDAIVLAKEIAAKEKCCVDYNVVDLLSDNLGISDYDIVLDKGTYDAISLSTDAKKNRETYINNVRSFLKSDGMLVITSCNWTWDELLLQFEDKFESSECVPTPQFKFGGKVGNVVTLAVFKNKK